jgi:hypothetical protein
MAKRYGIIVQGKSIRILKEDAEDLGAIDDRKGMTQTI